MHRAALRRWSIAVAGCVAVVMVPTVVAAWPAADSAVTAAALLERVRASAATPYSGLVESSGSLAVPDLPRVGDLGALFGGTSRLRVWWSGPRAWRVDRLTAIGEEDVYRDGAGTLEWDSERNRMTRVFGDPGVRAPRAGDLVPPELGRRLVAAATPDEVTRLPATRVARRPAYGLRVVPRDGRTTLGRVDLWVDAATGLPLRVLVVARGGRAPVLRTSFLDVRPGPPPADVVRFRFTPGARLSVRDAPDVVAAADRYAGATLPATLAGLPRRPLGDDGAAHSTAAYGAGYVALVAVPLRPSDTWFVLRALRTPLAEQVDVADRAALLRLALVNALVVDAGDRGYLLVGTVQPDVLRAAARQLASAPPGTGAS